MNTPFGDPARPLVMMFDHSVNAETWTIVF